MKVISIDNILKNATLILLFTTALLFTISYLRSKKRDKALKYYSIYLIVVFSILVGSILIIDIQKALNIPRNNLYLSHFYFIFQFIFLSLFYSQLFTKKQIKYQKFISVLVFLVLAIQYTVDPSLFSRFNLLEIFITSFPLIIYSIFHLYNSLSKAGRFMYINAGILVYLSVSTLIFILGNYLSYVDKGIAADAWFLNRVFYVGYLVIILIEWKKSLLKTKD